ncbi:MAG TPA: chromosome segregation protein SMC [bacterium]|nr:chromosome segregation protein SMC [bacterium]
MILSKIALQGFKSFAKKIELRFDGRITAVVGPNGCGKTNIVDAIRWGLGEQRTSVLRADRMESVIFGGAHSSRPLGMAEVSVIFDNKNHVLPIDYNEVMITRRLYRSGESEYLLNKTQVRLKDIQDLLMDTGIGADMYSVIELKMVEDILSDKAEDRRKLMEEAAGVTKYKYRLRAAGRKLEATRNDLLRVNDIIQEVERSVNALKRQEQRARRYKALQDELMVLELNRAKTLFVRLEGRLKPLRDELGDFRKQREGRTTTITREEADLESLKLKQVEQEKALTDAREALSEVVEKIHKRESDIRVGRERTSSLEERIVRHTKEIENLKVRLSEIREHLEITQTQRESLQVKVASTGRLFNNKKKELEVFHQGLNLKRLDFNGKKKAIIECLESINQLSSEETRTRARLENSRGRLERLDEEDQGFRESLGQVQTMREKSIEAHGKLESAQREAIQKKADFERRLLEKQQRLDLLKEQILREQNELELNRGRLDFLRQVVESREGLPDGARKLLEEKVPGLKGLLPDLIDTPQEIRRAVEAGLGEAVGYLVVDRTDNALSAVRRLKRRGGGQVAIICLDRISSAGHGSRPSIGQEGVLGWADERVGTDDAIRPVVRYLLGDTLIVKDLETASQVMNAVSKSSIRIVTLNGEVLTPWGIAQNRKADSEALMVGRLQRMKELEKQAGALEKQLDKTRDRKEETHRGQIAIEEALQKLESELLPLTEKITDTDRELARNQFERERAEGGLSRNAEERQKLLEEIERLGEELENIRPRMESMLEKRETLERASAQIQGELDRLEGEEAVMEEEVHRLNLNVVRLNGEARSLDYDIEHSRRLVKEVEETIDQRNREIEEARVTIARQKDELEINSRALEEEHGEKEAREARLEAQESRYQVLVEEVRSREEEVRKVRRDRDAAAEHVHQLEMKITELEHEQKTIRERIRETYEMDLDRLQPEKPLDPEECEIQIEEIRRKMKGLGVVNMMALEEYDQQKERLDFLIQQRDDLLSAEENLEETIQKINRTARKRFVEVFNRVRENFRDSFGRFFQGGEADLRLGEGEDPLEAQVEIIARPAGKHFRDLSLLSGGERALTAIALLFALYQVKPSPFCILDEIDAPLDDANIQRFTRVLREFAQKTQFVIVTHNKMTMKAAGALYGVTMEEEGVSKVVSVKFDESDEPVEEAA